MTDQLTTPTLSPQTTHDRQVSVLRRAMGPVVLSALEDPKVVEVMVNPDGVVWVDRVGQAMTRTGRMSAADSQTIIRLVANHIGQTADASRPHVAGTLPVTGERFQGVLPPLTDAPTFAVRKPPKHIFRLDDYIASGVMTPKQARVIRHAVRERKNIVISGGTGTGKTTLANAVLAEPDFANERVVVLEDTRELQCSSKNQVMLLTHDSEPKVTLTDLLRYTLRLRPDRIVVGECRGPETLDMVQAMNTGHPGSLTTLHADTATQTMQRIEDMVGLACENIPYRSIALAINLIVHLERHPEGRRVSCICQVKGYHPDTGYATTEL